MRATGIECRKYAGNSGACKATSALRLRASQDAIGLVDDYSQTLGLYLQRRSKVRGSERKAEKSPATRLLVADAIRRLNELDTQREALRKGIAPQLTIRQ